MMLNTEMVEVLKKAIKEHNESRKAIEEPSQPPILGVSSLHSLLDDLKGFESMSFLNADVKSGLGLAIEQVERYIRRDTRKPTKTKIKCI